MPRSSALSSDQFKRRLYGAVAVVGPVPCGVLWLVERRSAAPDEFTLWAYPLLMLACLPLALLVRSRAPLVVVEWCGLGMYGTFIVAQFASELLRSESAVLSLLNFVVLAVMTFVGLPQRPAAVVVAAGYVSMSVVAAVLAARGFVPPEPARDLAAALVSLGVALALLYGFAWFKERLVAEEREASRWRMLAFTDALTKVGNRRMLTVLLEDEFEVARRSGEGLAVAFVDADHFKAVNDRFGHAVGDRVLYDLARVLEREVGALGVVGRWGGEEFLVLLPSPAHADELAERLRVAVDAALSVHGSRVTVSVGLASLRDDDTTSSLLARADVCLYRAKHEGRNRVVSDQGGETLTNAPKA